MFTNPDRSLLKGFVVGPENFDYNEPEPGPRLFDSTWKMMLKLSLDLLCSFPHASGGTRNNNTNHHIIQPRMGVVFRNFA
jgi:hypothetical protein